VGFQEVKPSPQAQVSRGHVFEFGAKLEMPF
jgi:hypothetical protein